MYLCFCKMPSLQWYFVECGKEKCEDSEGAISFGLNLCDGEFFESISSYSTSNKKQSSATPSRPISSPSPPSPAREPSPMRDPP